VVAELRRGEQVLPAEGFLAPSEPKRVIRPETAATLRRLMEGVILNGTGTRAHLEGWTAAGKTGSAQKIDPATGRYSHTQLIASFTGFAPISNPAVTILVSLDSPVGEHEGGQVAAPVFKRIAEQVLPYLDVPRDVPVGARLLNASYKKGYNDDGAALSDFTPADFSAQPDQPPAEFTETNAKETKGGAQAVTMAVEESGDIAVPDFAGKTMREVTEACLRMGLDPILVGSGLAVNQKPVAEAKLRRGAKVTVQFGAPTQKIAKPHRKGRR
jgi:cell division protein FtsI (penicillin-binding protein 3)